MQQIVSNNSVSREERNEEFLASTRAASRTAAAVRRREGLMKIEMHNIEPHISRPCDTHYSVEIGSIIVAKTSGFMDDIRYFEDILVKKTYCVRVCQHQTCSIFTHSFTECVKIDTSILS